jgi:hypothetical protein
MKKMNEIKTLLNKLWQVVVKFLLSKTTLDEKLADKVEQLHEKMESIDQIDQNTEVKPKSKTKKKLTKPNDAI